MSNPLASRGRAGNVPDKDPLERTFDPEESIKQRTIDPEESIKHGKFYDNPEVAGKRSLIIFSHGISFLFRGPRGAQTRYFEGLLGRLLGEEGEPFRSADFLPFNFVNHLFSRTTLEREAGRLADLIDHYYKQRKYERLYVVGYSTGSLLVRRAILIGHDRGQVWAGEITRLILLANSNRGFVVVRHSAAGVGEVSGFWRTVMTVLEFTGLWDRLPRWGLARLVTDVYRDSPWVRDLRIGWLTRFENPRSIAAKLVAPRTVQIFGTADQLVGDDDTQEVYLYGRTEVIRLAGYKHETFLTIPRRVVSPGSDLERGYEVIRECFRKKLKGVVARPEEAQRAQIVFLIHGIRDYADWQENLAYQIRKIFKLRHSNRGQEVEVIFVRYGYFNAFQFPFTSQRLRSVRAFVDAYYQARARFPYVQQDDIQVLAHSNGTFVLAEAMKQCREIKVNRMVLAGSVLPRSFDWPELVKLGQVRDIHNICGNVDWPVGLLCQGLSGLKALGLGTGGYHGFDLRSIAGEAGDPNRVFLRNSYLEGDHGVALQIQRHEAIAKHLLGHDGYDLQCLSSMDDASRIPTEGRDLVVVAEVNDGLHFRLFDNQGKKVEADEKSMTGRGLKFDGFRKQLERESPFRLTRAEKSRIGSAVTAIVGCPDYGRLPVSAARTRRWFQFRHRAFYFMVPGLIILYVAFLSLLGWAASGIRNYYHAGIPTEVGDPVWTYLSWIAAPITSVGWGLLAASLLTAIFIYIMVKI